jgi:hypothetical protein
MNEPFEYVCVGSILRPDVNPHSAHFEPERPDRLVKSPLFSSEDHSIRCLYSDELRGQKELRTRHQ